MVNFEVLFNQESDFRKELQLEFNEFKERADEIEALLEGELQEVQAELTKSKNETDDLKSKMNSLKATHSKEKNGLEQQIECLRKANDTLEQNARNMRSKLIQAENDVEYLESQNRALQMLNGDLEQKIDNVLEELALLQTELEENRSHHENYIESIERLKQQVRDTENELLVLQLKQSNDRGGNQVQQQEGNHVNLSASVNASQIYVSAFSQNSPLSTMTSESMSCSSIIPSTGYDSEQQQSSLSMNGGILEGFNQRRVKKQRGEKAPNLTYSFKPAEIESLSKLYIENQKEKLLQSHTRMQETFGMIPQQPLIKSSANSSNPQYKLVNNSGSNQSNGGIAASPAANPKPIRMTMSRQGSSSGSGQSPTMHARGRKMTNPNTPVRQRYSEERNGMKLKLERIMNEKMQVVDKNFKATEIGFSKTLHFVSNLIKDIDETMGPLRNKKAIIAATPRNAFKNIQFNPELVL